VRVLVVFIRLFPFVVAFLSDRRRFIVFGRPRRRDEERHRRRAVRLTRTLADLGPAFIKLAQVFAARADILPEPYLSAIGTLTDQVPPLSPGIAEQVIREELENEPSRSPRPRWDRCTARRTRVGKWW
jgi:predicted unusual protein kinase regulating ubiquinone biosynthesis (AarF/ABC1/UbiB family)